MRFNIVEYRPEYQLLFEKFNKAWLEEYFTVEPIDKWVLENPEEAVLRDGGRILFIEYDNQMIGTAALKKLEDGVFELTKMAVEKNHRGIGAGKFLCKAAVDQAKAMNARKLILYSQTLLKPAISIYRSLGFNEIPVDGKYQRADIKMEINFTTYEKD
jgi:GNAT superfamily N-acetyltransferase